MRPRVTAGERYRRILAMIPWIAERDSPTIVEVCTHFGITEEELIADLDVVLMIGVPPYSPGDYIDVRYESGHIDLRLDDYFTRPLRLTATEALALLASGAGLRASEADPDGPISRALRKLQAALGVPDDSFEITLGPADAAILETLRTGLDQRHSVEIDYYTNRTDTSALRVIDPYRIYSAEGHWYVSGFCHRVDDLRLFRVDRIRAATATESTFDEPSVLPDTTLFAASAETPRIVLDVGPDARWATTSAHPDSVEDLGGGRSRVVLPVGGTAWLERLLIGLGDHATVVDPSTTTAGSTTAGSTTGLDPSLTYVTPDEAAEVRNDGIARILRRYRDN